MIGKIRKEFNKILGRIVFPLFLSEKCSSDKILLIKNDSLGDFLFFSGILNYYIRHFGDRVYCLINSRRVDEAFARLYTNNIITVDRDKYFFSLKYRYNLLKLLNGMGFAIAVAGIHNSSESRDLLRLLKVPSTYLYAAVNDKKLKGWRDGCHIIPALLRLSAEGTYTRILSHEKKYLESILSTTVSDKEIEPHIPLPDNISESVINKLSLAKKEYIVFALSSGSKDRNYPTDKFLKVIKHLYERLNCQVVLIGHEKRNSSLADYLIDLRGKTSLIEALSIIKHSRLFIGNETGLTHAAWIMEVPTIMICGGGHFGGFMPVFDSGHVVCKQMDCFCCDWVCKYDEVPFPCVGKIKVEDIIKEVERIIAE